MLTPGMLGSQLELSGSYAYPVTALPTLVFNSRCRGRVRRPRGIKNWLYTTRTCLVGTSEKISIIFPFSPCCGCRANAAQVFFLSTIHFPNLFCRNLGKNMKKTKFARSCGGRASDFSMFHTLPDYARPDSRIYFGFRTSYRKIFFTSSKHIFFITLQSTK